MFTGLTCNSSDIFNPYCGTYSFHGGTYNYNCQSTSQFSVESVEYLRDYYITAVGSSLTSNFHVLEAATTDDSFGSGSTSNPTSTRSPSHSGSNSDNNDDNANVALGAAAIGGIAAGAGLVICLIIGLLVWCCLRRRKRARLAASQNMAQHAPPTFAQPQPMDQQSQTTYQPVPQQDTQYHGSGQFQPTQSGYFGGAQDPQKDPGAFTHVSPVGSPSPSTIDPAARPFSMVSTQHPHDGTQTKQHLSPPLPGYAGPLAGGGAAQEYYKQPSSPSVTEVDGTQGNPGVPYGSQQRMNEVDGTQGNPGVPHHEHYYHGPYEMH